MVKAGPDHSAELYLLPAKKKKKKRHSLIGKTSPGTYLVQGSSVFTQETVLNYSGRTQGRKEDKRKVKS